MTIIKNILKKQQLNGIQNLLVKNKILLESKRKLKATDIRTMPYPGFPTDMQSIFVAMLCVASGTSIIVENIFENRFKFVQELQRMGARIKIEGKTAVIKGVRKLYGTEVKATDLRGGASLVLAGLVARKKTQVNDIKYILRGYENLDEKLKKIGANIKILI